MRDGEHTTAQVIAYQRSFAKLCAGTITGILDLARDRLGRGCVVLDVGAGTGNLAHAAAECGATVSAVDADPSMVAHGIATSDGVPTTWTVGRAEELPYADGRFDVVSANFVINHVATPGEAMRQMHRVASADGRVITTIWDGEPSPLRTLWREVVQASGADSPPPDHIAPEHDFERSVDGLADLHARSGGNVLHCDVMEWDWRIAKSDLWQAVEHGLAGIGRLYLHNPPAIRNAIGQAFQDITRDMADEEGTLTIPSRAPIVMSVPHS